MSAWAAFQRRRVDTSLATLAARLGGTVDVDGFLEPPSVHAAIDGCDVVVDTITRRFAKRRVTYTRVRVSGAPRDLAAKGEGLRTRLGRLVGWTDRAVGDPAFDGAVYLQAHAAAWLAAFDETARGRLRAAVAAGAVLDDGIFRHEERGAPTDPDALERLVRQLVAAAVALRGDGEAPGARLARMALTDPIPAVRAHALATLVRQHLAEAEDAAAWVREAVGQVGEDAMIAALDRGPDLAVAAAHWLARHGTVQAVPALRAAATSLPDGSPQQRVVHEAVAAIQADVQPGMAGALGMVEDGGELDGAVSEAERVSVAADSGPRRS